MRTKKFYSVNCHYDMVVTVDVVAESEDDAIDQAKQQADFVSIDKWGECYGSSECIADEQELTDELQRQADDQFKNDVEGYREIKTFYDVAQFIQYLVFVRNCNVNPDDPFDGYQDKDGNKSFTEQECRVYGKMIDKCFDVCEAAGIDIYEICMRVLALFHLCDGNGSVMAQLYDNCTIKKNNDKKE